MVQFGYQLSNFRFLFFFLIPNFIRTDHDELNNQGIGYQQSIH